MQKSNIVLARSAHYSYAIRSFKTGRQYGHLDAQDYQQACKRGIAKYHVSPADIDAINCGQVSEERTIISQYADYTEQALFELAHYTLKIIGEHTSQYESTYLEYAYYKLTEAEQETYTVKQEGTKQDIAAMTEQYKRVMTALYARGLITEAYRCIMTPFNEEPV